MPSALEYFSYVWHFQSLMAGPLVFYKDYIEFVEGYNLLKRPASNVSGPHRCAHSLCNDYVAAVIALAKPGGGGLGHCLPSALVWSSLSAV